ncbi:hypothetical protein DPMN_008627 [Dreissena polymorpha]|uniref:Uncharacterized protein n=1 Tax=Dreissena polymorpha TaxID=45954 RepID=A0A9D4MVM2_DREPO|nr:hypothetical protein DPMN_008627 [Dreissena polymorpha]
MLEEGRLVEGSTFTNDGYSHLSTLRKNQPRIISQGTEMGRFFRSKWASVRNFSSVIFNLFFIKSRRPSKTIKHPLYTVTDSFLNIDPLMTLSYLIETDVNSNTSPTDPLKEKVQKGCISAHKNRRRLQTYRTMPA